MIRIYAETERLILREFLAKDAEDFFEMDSDPEVHRYLGNNPAQHVDDSKAMIESIRQQYADHGIGRWAAIEKATGQFIGWSGLKFIVDPEKNQSHFYDVGYRLMRKHWGKGYATESAKAALQYGFEQMGLTEIIGTAHEENVRSRHALEKCGLRFVEKFDYKGLTCDWLSISKNEWEELNNKTNKS